MADKNPSFRPSSLGLIIILCLALSIFTSSCDRKEDAAQGNRGRAAVTGPIIDPNLSGGVMDRLELNSQSPESLAILGDRYFESGNYVQAIKAYRKALEKNPMDVDTYNDLGLSLQYIGQPNEAIDILRQGSQLDPNYQNVWLSLGFVLFQSAKNEEASTALKHAAEINPNTPQGLEAKKILESLN